jgi:hypothetical protein
MAVGTGAAILGSAALGIGGAALSKPKAAKDPYAFLRPYMNTAAGDAQSLYGAGGPQQYQGSSVAGPSDTTLSALQQQLQRAQSGSPLVDQAQQFAQQGLQQPISSQFGGAQNPYANPVGANTGANPYANPVGADASANPYANPVSAAGGGNPYASAVNPGSSLNPFATGPNPFGGASNPLLDATFDQAAQRSLSRLESEFAGSGRNIEASAPARADMLSSLASQIYAPAYENERNRQLSYGQQQLGIGAQGFESGQQRQLQSGLAAQGIGAGSYEALADRQLQSGLQGQQIGAQGFENARSQGLQARLAGQSIGAQGYENARSQQLQAGLAGQQIGAQGYENAQSRQLSDLTSQRSLQQNLLGYATPLAAQDYADIAQQRDVGNAYDQQSQAQLSDTINRFNQQQQRPYANLDSYIARLTGLAGGTAPLPTQAPQPDYLSAGLGGALLGSQFFGGQKMANYGQSPDELAQGQALGLWG